LSRIDAVQYVIEHAGSYEHETEGPCRCHHLVRRHMEAVITIDVNLPAEGGKT